MLSYHRKMKWAFVLALQMSFYLQISVPLKPAFFFSQSCTAYSPYTSLCFFVFQETKASLAKTKLSLRETKQLVHGYPACVRVKIPTPVLTDTCSVWQPHLAIILEALIITSEWLIRVQVYVAKQRDEYSGIHISIKFSLKSCELFYLKIFSMFNNVRYSFSESSVIRHNLCLILCYYSYQTT